MSDRIKDSWQVLNSYETQSGDYCVDIFQREDGSFGFEEFRRDVEDGGRWTAISYYSVKTFASLEMAIESARNQVAWLDHELGSKHHG